MVIILYSHNQLLLAVRNNLVQYDLQTQATKEYTVPDPVANKKATDSTKKIDSAKEPNTITAASISKNDEYIVITTNHKQVIVLRKNNFATVQSFSVQRLASKVTFTNSNDVLVADKTGDVLLFKVQDWLDQNEPDSIKPTLLLGHLSIILDIAVSPCAKYLITCDRDEKIRVSHYPNAYNIASFCLGHTEFITAVKVFENVLVSASGDGTIRTWDYVNGHQLDCIDTNKYVKNQELLTEFCRAMDTEKVDISALPVTQLTICPADDCLFIAVTLHKYRSVQLYKTDLNFCKIEFVNNVECTGKPIGLCFADSANLYVLDSDSLKCYNVVDKKFNDCNLDSLHKLLQNGTTDSDSDNNLMALYKRKFDTVQEYFERKRQRLEQH